MEQKERIAKYAFTLFRDNGIRSVSMSEIASNLGISKRTLYELFENKEDLLIFSLENYKKLRYELLDEMMVESANSIDMYFKLLNQNITEENWNVKFFDDIEKYFHKVYDYIQNWRVEQIDLIKIFLKKGIEEGMFRDNLNIEIYSFLLVDLGETYLRALKKPSLPFTVKELAYEMNINLLRGIATSKGLDIIDDNYKNKNILF